MNYQKKYNLCVGFVEFDDIEGPMIVYQYPPSFPLDVETSFEIADFSLYVEGKTQFEIRDFIVVSYPFKILDENYARKYRKYALVIIVFKEAWKSKLEKIIYKANDNIVEIIESIKRKIRDRQNIAKITNSIYSMITKSPSEARISEKNDFDTRNVSSKEKALEKIVENTAIVDFRLKYLICTNKRIIEEFISNPTMFRIVISTNRTLVAIIRRDIIDSYDSIMGNIKRNIKRNIDLLEKNKKIITNILEDLIVQDITRRTETHAGGGI